MRGNSNLGFELGGFEQGPSRKVIALVWAIKTRVDMRGPPRMWGFGQHTGSIRSVSHPWGKRAVVTIDFTALDFETANSDRASVCAVGAVKVRGGEIVATFSTLVRPPEGFGEFAPINVSIHGISESAVAEAPGWPEVFRGLIDFVGGDLIVGHNAALDMSVLLDACSVNEIDWPELDSLCTMRLARSVLSIPSYSLPWVSVHLGLAAFDHHNALEDAVTSARVLLEIATRLGVTSLSELQTRTSVHPVRIFQDPIEPALAAIGSAPDPIIGNGFEGDFVCFTGGLRVMVREAARELVTESGGVAQSNVTKKTTVLVTGDFDLSTFRPGAAFGSKLQRAFELSEAGQKLEILTEDEFVTRLSLREEELRNRVARGGAARSHAPDYVVEQARLHQAETNFWAWYRKALASPLGRATGGEPCIWCESKIQAKSYWMYKERHVCNGGCNEKLKRSAKRLWQRSGIVWPTNEQGAI